MEKDKSRGLKHIKDKRKYKGNSTKDPKHVPAKSIRNLDSNCYRYEREDNTQGFQLTSSTDFSILANAPITQGYRFQFKSDKIIAEDTENKAPLELFSLDLNMVNNSILTVPFYQRVGIGEEYFTKDQLGFMKRDAEDNLLKYNQKYNTKKIIQDDRESTNININTEKCENIEVAVMEEMEKENNCFVQEVDDTQKPVSKLENLKNLETKEKKCDEDLEQWLDDILGD